MAGLGRKVFTRERATVADVNGYLMDQTVMRFPSASAANTAISSPSEGMHRYLDDVNRLEFYNGSAWSPVPSRTIDRVATIPGSASIPAGGAVETGVTSGYTALPNFVMYRSGWFRFTATFRAGGAGAALCSVKINGATVGNVAVSRSDGTVTVTGALSLATGTHTISARVDASGGTVGVVDIRITGHEGSPE